VTTDHYASFSRDSQSEFRGQGASSLTHKVGANLQRLISPHNNPNLAPLPILQKLNIPRPSLLPLHRSLLEPKQLGSDLEEDIFIFLGGFSLDLFGELDDGFVMRVVLLGLDRSVINFEG
jgi:hypothetical protein